MADDTVISEVDVDNHLKSQLIPYVISQYERTNEVHATVSQLIADFIAAVEKTKSRDEVFLLFLAGLLVDKGELRHELQKAYVIER